MNLLTATRGSSELAIVCLTLLAHPSGFVPRARFGQLLDSALATNLEGSQLSRIGVTSPERGVPPFIDTSLRVHRFAAGPQ